jgi:hypothetical protein
VTAITVEKLPWNEIGLRVEPKTAAPMLANLPAEEVVSRLKSFAVWSTEVGTRRATPIALTPVIAEFLAQPDDYESRLDELDRLVGETRDGRFERANLVQRDMEYTRFAIEYRRAHDSSWPDEDLYTLFTELDSFPLGHEKIWSPSDRDLLEIKRAAFEAVGFLRFLEGFRAGTSRPIVVIGNDKGQLLGGGYGRTWVVEPLEEYLLGDFDLRYDRVTSHGTTRLNTPSPFPTDFVKRLCDEMPHLVIVDGAGPSRLPNTVRFSRVPRGYANWFAVFNDLRVGARTETGAQDMLPANHLDELRTWHEYTVVKEIIEPWVTPGRAYASTLWAPEQTATALMGEIVVPWSSPVRGDDTPQIVYANPIVYRTDLDGGGRAIAGSTAELPEYLSRTMPYYLDSVDKRLRVMSFTDEQPRLTTWGETNDNPEGPVGSLNPTHTVFGFGKHGFERRAVGPSVAKAVSVLQEQLKSEIREMLGR